MIARKKLLLLAVMLLLLSAGLLLVRFTHTPFPWETSNTANQSETQVAPGNSLENIEREADNTVWAKEMLAQRCGRTFESVWDTVNAATNKLSVLAAFPVNEILLGSWGPPRPLPHGIELRQSTGSGRTLSAGEWRLWVETFAREGWQLDNLEFRHVRFDTNNSGLPRQSHFYFAARLTNPATPERAVVEGDLVVDWEDKEPNEAAAAIKRIDASHLTVKTRRGEPIFQLLLQDNITPPKNSSYSDPLILYDLDGDGLSEIILAAKNLVYRRSAEGHYQPEPLCRYPAESITSAVIADFDGDGSADFLCANSKGLWLFKGSPQGTFAEPGRLAWPATSPLKNTMVLTCGDIDGDGDLDIFLGQYKVPTLGQILRPYYYDANDGYPSYLLLNDGKGNFKDVTEAAGLGAKRWRRVYSASLADLNGDGHLDLMVVSDFAGLDLYRSDGKGHFSDVTPQWVAEPHGFGMGHALADFNSDGRLDLLMIGMPSPTVDRLEHLGLWRPSFAKSDTDGRPYSTEERARRAAMAFGNRLYVARSNNGFEQTSLSDSIARSGWSWGCSAFDFDNDGFPDVYIANGLQSKESVRDYESEFWLHDIFVGETVDDLTATRYFMEKFNRTRGQGWSYGGYEKNRLFLNEHGESFLEIGHLAGVALEQDSRNVVADDLDGDGRVDLLVTTLEVWPEAKQTLQVFKNVFLEPWGRNAKTASSPRPSPPGEEREKIPSAHGSSAGFSNVEALPEHGHWIGFRFREEAGKPSPVGVRVTVHYNGRSATRQIVTGDSHRSQHANTLHFGLGEVDQVDRAEIRWPDGRTVTLTRPEVDRYHLILEPRE